MDAGGTGEEIEEDSQSSIERRRGEG